MYSIKSLQKCILIFCWSALLWKRKDEKLLTGDGSEIGLKVLSTKESLMFNATKFRCANTFIRCWQHFWTTKWEFNDSNDFLLKFMVPLKRKLNLSVRQFGTKRSYFIRFQQWSYFLCQQLTLTPNCCIHKFADVFDSQISTARYNNRPVIVADVLCIKNQNLVSIRRGSRH